jgi:hypothetical protein
LAASTTSIGPSVARAVSPVGDGTSLTRGGEAIAPSYWASSSETRIDGGGFACRRARSCGRGRDAAVAQHPARPGRGCASSLQ